LNSADPFTLERGQFEAEATSVLLEDAPISLEIAQELLSL